MKTGILQRRWSAQLPEAFDRECRYVRMDIIAESREENGETVNGYSYVEVQIDKLIDYGHIKSQLIEAGYPQKDEFGLLMNAVNAFISSVKGASSWANFKSAVNEDEALAKFQEFCEYRSMCADAAATVVQSFANMMQ